VDRLGYDTIIDAVALLRTRIPNLVLRIVGHGDGRYALAARAEARGIRDRVQIYQGVVLDKIPELIESSDIGVVANKNDPFADLPLPTKLLEFAWMGKPVVSSRTTTIGHYFDDSQVAFFEPGNAADLASRIEELYNDPRRRILLAQNAGRFFDRYNWPNEARRYVDLVNGLIDHGTPAGTDVKSEQLSKALR
jgi:glycosyltransferase involved in cell wall biosynthesis